MTPQTGPRFITYTLGVLIPALLATGCGGLWGGRTTISQHPSVDRTPPVEEQIVLDPPPAPPEEDTSDLDERETAALTDGEMGETGEKQRPGNPAQWGAGAQIAIDREFEPVFFEEGSAELSAASTRRLNEYARWLTPRPRVWMTLAGHCGRADTIEYAYNLGMARALAAKDYLVSQGIGQRRLFTISYGSDWPAVEGETETSRALNARVEFLAFVAPQELASPTPVDVSSDEAPEPVAPETPPPPIDIE